MSECACQTYIDDIKLAAREAVMQSLMRQITELERQRAKHLELIENLTIQVQQLEQRHGKSTNP